MLILKVPAKLYAQGDLLTDDSLDKCLDDFAALDKSKRSTAEIIADGQAYPDGGRLHWQMTPADADRLCDMRAMNSLS